jgi:hypothetical protein
MKHATKKQLMAIPAFTLLATVGLVACDQPREPTSEAIRAPETQNVAPEPRSDEPGAQGQENSMERTQPDSQFGSPPEATEPGQSEANTPDTLNRVVFRVKEHSDTMSDWTRLTPTSTDSRALDSELDNHHSNESIASTQQRTQHQWSVERSKL